MNEKLPAPVCPECDRIIWPNEEVPRAFIWYEGDKADDPPKEELVRGAITHPDCAEAFGARLEASGYI